MQREQEFNNDNKEQSKGHEMKPTAYQQDISHGNLPTLIYQGSFIAEGHQELRDCCTHIDASGDRQLQQVLGTVETETYKFNPPYKLEEEKLSKKRRD